jgi:hypothetical protein
MYKMPTTKNLNEELVFILERQSSVLESSRTDNDDYVLEGTAAVFGKENNNNRIYEEAEYLPHLNYLNEKIAQRRLVGELDHPEKFDVSLKNISHIIEKLDYDKGGREIKIKVRLLDTPMGQIAKNLVDAGVPLSISSRAAGSVGNDKKVQIKKIFTYDLVADPGFQDAQLERVYESAGYHFSDFFEMRNKSVTNDLLCVNESLGLKNDSGVKIYKVENNEEFNNLVSKSDKNKTILMENNEFVTAEELNQYSVFLKKEMEAMNSKIAEIKEQKQVLTESSFEDKNSNLEERVAKLEKYSEYLAENLDNAIKYGEYLAENLDESISYSKYLAENLDKNISYSKYLAENRSPLTLLNAVYSLDSVPSANYSTVTKDLKTMLVNEAYSSDILKVKYGTSIPVINQLISELRILESQKRLCNACTKVAGAPAPCTKAGAINTGMCGTRRCKAVTTSCQAAAPSEVTTPMARGCACNSRLSAGSNRPSASNLALRRKNCSKSTPCPARSMDSTINCKSPRAS